MTKKILSNRYITPFFLILFVIFGMSKGFSQCPTVVTASQTFCNSQSPTVANLVATNNGNGVVWYATAVSITPLSSGASLVSGDYFADDNSGTCGARPKVTVTVYEAPTGSNFQGVCVGNPSQATVANLVANGNAVKWYLSDSGGSALPSTTILIDGTLYYASQTNPFTGCETSRLRVFVSVKVVATPTGNQNQTFCNNPSSPPTIANLVASGVNNWYSSTFSAVPLSPSTPLVNGQNYFATTVDPPCESINRLQVTVTLLPMNNSGISGTLQICSNQIASNPTHNLFDSLGGTPDATGVWSGPLPTSNGNLGTVNVSTLTAAGSPYTFTYTVNNGVCTPSSSTVTITISDPKNAGTNGSLKVCSNGAPQNLFAHLGGTPQVGGIWSPAMASGTGVFNPAIDAAGVYTYTVTGSVACGNASAAVTVTVVPKADAGTNGTLIICISDPSTNLFSSLGGTPQLGGTWSPALASGTGFFNPAIDAAGTYTYTVTGVFPCVNATATVKVTVNPNITPTFTVLGPYCQNATPGSLSTTSTNVPPITGTWSPATISTASVGTQTYTFTPTAGQCALTTTMLVTVNPNITPIFTPVPPICSGSIIAPLPTISNNGITGTWAPALNNSTTTIYTFTPTAGQCATTATTTIMVTPIVIPTFDAVPPICSGDALAPLPTTSNNGITGAWAPALNNTTTTIYTFIPTTPSQCAVNVTLTVIVNQIITPTFNAVPPICSGDALAPLPTTSNNGITGTWAPALNNTATTTYTFTPAAGQCAVPTTLTITVNSKIIPIFDPVQPICSGRFLASLPTTSNNGITGTWAPALNNTATTTYTFTPTAGQCATTATLTITVIPNVTPTFAAVSPICAGDALAPLPTTSNNGITGTWAPALNNTVTTTYTFIPTAGQCAITTTLTITVNQKIIPIFAAVAPICSGDILAVLPTTSTNGITGTWAPALDNTTTTTYTFTPTAGQCATTTTLTITVDSKIIPTFDTVAPICAGGVLTALPTTSNNGITGTWAPALDNTTTTTYTFTPTTGQCAAITTLTITVNSNVTPIFDPVTPICSGGTLAPLPTTSNNGITGTWAPALDNTTTTTYTFTPTAGQCATTATLTITVNPNVTPTFDPVAPICVGGTLAPLPTTSTNGITGTWTPALDNTTTTTYTFTPTAGQCATTTTLVIIVNPNITPTFDPVASICTGSPLAPLPTTSNNGITGTWAPALDNTATTTYTFTPTAGQCATTTTLTITVDQIADAGTDGTLVTCSNVTHDLFLSLGGTPQGGGVWSPALASGTGMFDPAVDPAGVYTYTITNLCGTFSATVTVSVTMAPDAGTNATVTLCANSPSEDLFLSLGGTPQTGGVWSPALASGTGVFDPAVDTAGVYTYTVAGTAPCADGSASATVTVNPLPSAGTDAIIVTCSNTSQDLFTSLGGTPNSGGVWSPALASGTGLFDPAVDAAGVYTYTITDPCGTDSATVTVSITTAPDAGTSGTVVLCFNSPSQDLFLSLGGTPEVGGVWSPAMASGTGVFDPAVDAAGVYTYTVAGTVPCANAAASVTVTVNPLPSAGTDAIIVTCSNTSQDLFASLGGTPLAGGVWSPALASGTGLFDPAVDAVGVYTYTVTDPCGTDSATVTISITTAPDPGVSGSATFCKTDSSEDLFLILGNTAETGGVWSPVLTSGTGVFNPAIDPAGVYTYTVAGTAPCSDMAATITVVFEDCPITDITIPDGFSPNGDGINDEFVIKDLSTLYPNFSLEIYNRYGSVLYKGNANTPNWNGKASEGLDLGNGLLPTGVYFFIIEFNDGIRKSLQGRVYLSR